MTPEPEYTPLVTVHFSMQDFAEPDELSRRAALREALPRISSIDFITKPYLIEPPYDWPSVVFAITEGYIRFTGVCRSSDEILNALKPDGELRNRLFSLYTALKDDQGVIASCDRVDAFVRGME